MYAKFEVRIFSHFGAIILTPKNLRGHVTLATPPFRKKFSGVMSGLSLRACMPNAKFVSLVILELLSFSAQKFKGSRDPGHAPFLKKFFRSHVGTLPGSIRAKFEVRTFNHFEPISI